MKLKPFQKQDLARLALTDGAVLAWDPGLGKTWAMILWSLLKVGQTITPAGRLVPNAPVLLVIPGGLHLQTIEEANRIFKTTVTPLNSQESFSSLCSPSSPFPPQPGREAEMQSPLPVHGKSSPPSPSSLRPLCLCGEYSLPPGFYITSYTQLGLNGVTRFPTPRETWRSPSQALAFIHSWDPTATPARVAADYRLALASATLQARELGWHDRTPLSLIISSAGDDPAPDHFSKLSNAHQSSFTAEWCNRILSTWSASNNESRNNEPRGSIKCVASPTLADLITAAGDPFHAVCVDEATKMKSENAKIAAAVRQLNPACRLVLTATPIKNRLVDIFHLVHWASRAPGRSSLGLDPSALSLSSDFLARFPYESEDREQFAADFHVSEQALTLNGKNCSSRKSLTPQVCNIHRAWKLLAPNILRRRKKDIGMEIVPKQNHIIRIPMGTVQRAITKAHLEWNPLDRNGRPATGPKLAALRQAAVLPSATPLCQSTLSAILSGHRNEPEARRVLSSFDISASKFEIPPPLSLPSVSSVSPWLNLTPKLLSALKLIHQILERGEQFLLFSPLIEPLDHISALLQSAGVHHHILSGQVSEARRGRIIRDFRAGSAGVPAGLTSSTTPPIPGLLVSECMAEGHNLPRCNNLITLAYPWALDKILQLVDRIHRLNSEKPVNIYRLITDGTIDRRMEQGIDEKEDAQELVLDGQLLTDPGEELSASELLKSAALDFATAAETIDESTLITPTSEILLQIKAAAQTWPTPSITTRTTMTTPLPQPPPTNLPWWKLYKSQALAA